MQRFPEKKTFAEKTPVKYTSGSGRRKWQARIVEGVHLATQNRKQNGQTESAMDANAGPIAFYVHPAKVCHPHVEIRVPPSTSTGENKVSPKIALVLLFFFVTSPT